MLVVPTILRTIAKKIDQKGGRAVIVGGAVRDAYLGYEVKDYDIEVYGLATLEGLVEILSAFGRVDHVGKSFGVLKLKVNDDMYDFSFPRTEQKIGTGHRGFDVEVDGTLSFEEAAKRRDFTINAMGYDILTGEVLDPFVGVEDIQYKRLRHIDDATFIEDPLRLYRAVQFAARFGFEVAPQTATLCQKMVAQGMLEELPKERIYEEWKKLLLKAPKPSVGLELMRTWGVTARYFPELHALIGVPQDAKWHPEGDVWVHTLMSIDAMASILSVQGSGFRVQKKLKLLFAVLCHDLGKPLTTTIEFADGIQERWHMRQVSGWGHPDLQGVRIRAIGHEKEGLEPTRAFLYRLTNEHDFIEAILPLVEHHLKPSQFYAQGAKAGAIRRLATKVNIEELVIVAKADFLGRTTSEAKAGVYEAGEWLLAEATRLQVSKEAMPAWVQGRDLIAMGLQPSPKFKEILDALYTLQIDGVFASKEEALAYCKEHYV